MNPKPVPPEGSTYKGEWYDEDRAWFAYYKDLADWFDMENRRLREMLLDRALGRTTDATSVAP